MMHSSKFVILLVAGLSCVSPTTAQLPYSLQRTIQQAKKLSQTRPEEILALHEPVQDVLHTFMSEVQKGDEGRMNSWISQLKSDNSTQCVHDLVFMMESLMNNRSYWTIQMLDAVGKPPAGILQGNLKWLGSFSQCHNISKQQIGRFEAQYCGLTIGNVNPMAASQLMLNLGLCVPDSCTGKILQDLLNKHVFPYIPAEVSVLQVTCPAKSIPYTAGAIAVTVLLCVFAALLIAGTAYDLLVQQPRLQRAQKEAEIQDSSAFNSQSEVPETLNVGTYTPILGNINTVTGTGEIGIGGKILLAFSIYSNAAKLLNTSSRAEETLTCVHGVRFLSMSWVILGHSYAFSMYVVGNPIVLYDWAKRFTFQALIGATVSVDSFFLLSGLLVSYLTLNRLHSHGKVNWLLFYFHRFWRLTPPYMMIVAIWTTLLPYLGEGPMYLQQPDANCQQHWWQNILYINNFFSEQKQCIGWTWYLANDMQFFVVSPFFIYALHRHGVIGSILVAVGVVGNIILRGVISRVNNFGPGFIGQLDPTYFDRLYQAPWARYGVYLVGIYIGYLLHRHRVERKFSQIHPLIKWGCWVLAFACGISVVYGMYDTIQGHPMNVNVAALYNATFRTVWALALGWLVFACCTGHGGIINTFLSWSGMVTLSRLTYMAYLVHPIVMFYYMLTRQQPFMIDDIFAVWLFLGYLVVSYGFAFVLSLAFESPMIGLEKALLGRFNQ